MSRHSYEVSGKKVVLGLDLPLRNFFGQVQGSGTTRLLGDGEGYDATADGLCSLLAEAGSFGEVLRTVIDALEQDLRSFDTDGDLSYQRLHGEA